MARRRTPPAARPQRRDDRASKRSRQPSSWVVVLGLVGVFAGFFLARRLTATVAPVFYGWADADHDRLAVLLLAVYATGPPLLVGALALHRRRGPLAAAPLWLPVGLVLLVAVGSFPGRSDNGELSRALTRAAGGSPITASGDVFIAAGVAALPCFFLVSPFLVTWVFAQGIPGRVAPVRAIAGALIYVVTWVAAGTVVLATVDDTDARITWLETSAEVLAGGDDGVTGDFQVGLDASVLDVVDCDTAADRLRVDGREPELDGCRRALLVAATGRYDRDGVRTSSGELVAVVVQVGDEDELESLDAALDGVEILAGGGLPEPVGDVLTTPATAALALVIAAEDTGDIPLPAEGAGRRPLSRSLAYVAIGTAVGLYVSPPEETPASP